MHCFHLFQFQSIFAFRRRRFLLQLNGMAVDHFFFFFTKRTHQLSFFIQIRFRRFQGFQLILFHIGVQCFKFGHQRVFFLFPCFFFFLIYFFIGTRRVLSNAFQLMRVFFFQGQHQSLFFFFNLLDDVVVYGGVFVMFVQQCMVFDLIFLHLQLQSVVFFDFQLQLRGDPFQFFFDLSSVF